ncbi:DNA cytosine methyltransferase [Rosenbergiella epipactidis]|uniref:DNA cytosine methyltransferase n=1 Tax=Rosenbergiella epipactidis TaxID=1544694 RepID=UPI001F4D371C
MTAYYNEFDPKAAAWLRELIKQGHIADGVVDERSITDVKPQDLAGFTQCHFFAGIGGWSYALRLAGIPDDFPCWTGSPPCQPFSTAGKQLGQLDERHLAPTFMHLVDECKPAILFGEQVAAAIGKHWLDDLFNELERQGYACGSAVLPACSVGAPHKRDRLFFGAVNQLANNMRTEWNGERLQGLGESNGTQESRKAAEFTGCSDIDELADTNGKRPQGERAKSNSQGREGSDIRQVGLCDGTGDGSRTLAHTDDHRQSASEGGRESSRNKEGDDTGWGCSHGFWSNPDWLGCRDGKFRPVESGTFPLANGIPARVGRLRGYGNAIVPHVAAQFIGAFMDSIQDSECSVCGFPSEDDRWCEACEEIYQAKDPNYYDLGGSDAKDKASMQDMP